MSLKTPAARRCLPTLFRDLLALLLILGLIALGGALQYGKNPSVFSDRGWGMQVATRVAEGERLYGDVTWNHGPWPIYAFIFLFEIAGTSAQAFSWVGLGIATLAQLLTYRISRYLLPPGWALLVTIVVLFASDGGLWSYMLPYVTAVSWGALFGLVTVWGLLIFVDRKQVRGLVLAGLSTGCALLSKPEFAAACLGTGLGLVLLVVLFPSAFQVWPARRWSLVLAYLGPLFLVAGAGFGFLVWQVDWADVWSGLSGYRAVSSELGRIAWLGSTRAWLHSIAGMGIGLFLLVLFVGVSAPRAFKRHRRLIVATIVICAIVALVALVPIVLDLDSKDAVHALQRMLSGDGVVGLGAALARFETMRALRVWWTAVLSAGSLFLIGAILILTVKGAAGWIRGDGELTTANQKLIVLTLYSCLAAARFYFNMPYAFHKHHLNTLAPVVVCVFLQWVPQGLARRGYRASRIRWGHSLLVTAMLLWVVGNAVCQLDYWSRRQYFSLDSPRGRVTMNWDGYSKVFAEPFEAILSFTDDEDSIFVVGSYPGFYFLTGRANPTRWDYLGLKMELSTADVEEMLFQLKGNRPRLVVFSEAYRDWFESRVDAGGRVSDFLAENYRVVVLATEYFTVYEYSP